MKAASKAKIEKMKSMISEKTTGEILDAVNELWDLRNLDDAEKLTRALLFDELENRGVEYDDGAVEKLFDGDGTKDEVTAKLEALYKSLEELETVINNRKVTCKK